MVPGGGHILIIPIEHHPTLLSIPPEISVSIISEIETYKSALRSMYAAHGCSAATFEVARLTGKGGHAHIQVVPVPNTLSGAVEDAFRREGEMEGVDWQEDPEAALSDGGDRRHNYFRVELPDGKTMVHLLRPGKQFNLQFGRYFPFRFQLFTVTHAFDRTVLAQLMGLEHRTDWKACAQTEQEERADALAFKEAFADFDPTL
jgi:diadenosine tetraphosphate (Ap4A) HIT family hydrolase